MTDTTNKTNNTDTDSKTAFAGLGLTEPLLRALADEKYTVPTPIQEQSIPALLVGRDLLGIAQTGTGKTAAFTLPLLQRITAVGTQAGHRGTNALILAPTRELAVQIGESIRVYSRYLGIRHTVITGGVNQNRQVKAMSRGVDILVATPGRLLDLVKQGHVVLQTAQTLILDEADRMFDMGFIRDIRKIVAALPTSRQTMLFSATMPREIEILAREVLKNPARVEVTPEVVTVDRIDQHLYFVDGARKRALLETLMADPALARVLVFTRTKHGANRVAQQLDRAGVSVDAIHGNKSQPARQAALERFRNNHARVLVATDIASRGIDVDGVTHVINFDLPMEPESYVHRIGRTARAGAAGIALSFCDASERKYLRGIERLTKRPIAVVQNMPEGFEATMTRVRSEPREVEREKPSGSRGPRPFKSSGKPQGKHPGGPRNRNRRRAA